jgi:hypothetical protein
MIISDLKGLNNLKFMILSFNTSTFASDKYNVKLNNN